MTVDFVIIDYKCTRDVTRLMGEIEDTFLYDHTITVIDNTHDNRGFAAAANLGAELGSGEIIAFLNPDIHLTPDWAEETLIALATQPSLVISGPRLDDGYPWPRDVSRNGIKNWVCGACYFVRRKFFESVGGFDERFFFTYEETDLIHQAEDMGFDVLAMNQDRPTIQHIRIDTPFHGEQLHINGIRYREKWGL